MNNRQMLTVFLVLLSATLFATEIQWKTSPANNPVELGKVSWYRDISVAEQQSKKTGLPILVLFQEVPGKSTSKGFGTTALSHPMIVDAIEQFFIPVAIYNNKRGKDFQSCRSFGEATWNDPVVRIINSDRNMLAPRMARYNMTELVDGIIQAMHKSGIQAPDYLSLLKDNIVLRRNREFRSKSRNHEFTAIANSAYHFVPMIATQAFKVEEALNEGMDPTIYLSPSQVRLLDTIEAQSGQNWQPMTGKFDFRIRWDQVGRFIKR